MTRQIVIILLAILASTLGSLFLGWFLDKEAMYIFAILSSIIVLNNTWLVSKIDTKQAGAIFITGALLTAAIFFLLRSLVI